jgi:adenine phosphoribosyltransferase
VRSLEEFGLIAAEAGRFRPEDAQIVAAAARLQRYGFDARHLRAVHSAIQREAGLVERCRAASSPDRVAPAPAAGRLAGPPVTEPRSGDLRHRGATRPRHQGHDVTDLVPSGTPRLSRPGIVFNHPQLADAGGRSRRRRRSVARVVSLRPDIVLGAEPRGSSAPRAIRLGGLRDRARRSCRTTVTAKHGWSTAWQPRADDDAIGKGMRVLVHDDLLATGGTARATCDLAEAVGGTVVGCAFLIELAFLGGRERLAPFQVDALISYASEG